MNLAIVGTGAMGKVMLDYAEEEGSFNEIFTVEPLEKNPWLYVGEKSIDLIIDFSHPKAIETIYEFCRTHGGNIPVVLATTGYGPAEEKIISLLEKICPLDRNANYSKGIEVMAKICTEAANCFGDEADIRIVEAHHKNKKDMPGGTAKMLCNAVKIDEKDENNVLGLRMGSMPGEHCVYFALKDEILEIKHTAFSKKYLQ